MQNNLHRRLERLMAKEAALAAKNQTHDITRQRNAMLREIQEILKEIKGAASAPGGA